MRCCSALRQWCQKRLLLLETWAWILLTCRDLTSSSYQTSSSGHIPHGVAGVGACCSGPPIASVSSLTSLTSLSSGSPSSERDQAVALKLCSEHTCVLVCVCVCTCVCPEEEKIPKVKQSKCWNNRKTAQSFTTLKLCCQDGCSKWKGCVEMLLKLKLSSKHVVRKNSFNFILTFTPH